MAFIDRFTEPYRLSVENTYNHLLSDWFTNEIIAESTISTLITVGLYWALGLAYTAVDLTQKPRFLLRYKIQQNSSQVSTRNLSKLIRQVISNQVMATIVGFGLICLKYKHFAIQRHVPRVSRFVLEWAVFILVREVLFYYSHRMLHHPSVYKHIHKRHHEWQTPIAIVAIYCHPVEHFVSNVFPVLIGPLLMHSHNLTLYLWMIYVIVLTLNDHCGYHFPLNPFPPVFHDFHHLKFNVNYGILGVCDWLHGTDRIFRNSKYHKLHRIYFGLTPPVDLLYEVDKMK